jgi:hypothetical protein
MGLFLNGYEYILCVCVCVCVCVCGVVHVNVWKSNGEIKNIEDAKFSASIQYRIAISPHNP